MTLKCTSTLNFRITKAPPFAQPRLIGALTLHRNKSLAFKKVGTKGAFFPS